MWRPRPRRRAEAKPADTRLLEPYCNCWIATMPKTLFDKIWDNHVVHKDADGTCVLYIDRHLVHEVTSPQAFEGLRMSGRKVRRPDATLAVPDHNVPTTDRTNIADEESRVQLGALDKN